jgi:predicted phage terminase large subunit-like protein
LKTAWLQYYEAHERPESFDHIVQSWDTAAKATQLADYSVCTTWGVKGDKIYLLEVYRAKLDFPDLRRAAIQLVEQHRPDYVLVEDQSSGTQLIQELPTHGVMTVTACKPKGDKVVRFHRITCLFETGKVLIPRSAPWLAEFVYELTVFPTGRHDDQADSMTQALGWIQDNALEPGIIGYYRRMNEKHRKGES